MQDRNNAFRTNVWRVLDILNSAEGVLGGIDSGALKDGFNLLDFEPTPIGPKGIELFYPTHRDNQTLSMFGSSGRNRFAPSSSSSNIGLFEQLGSLHDASTDHYFSNRKTRPSDTSETPSRPSKRHCTRTSSPLPVSSSPFTSQDQEQQGQQGDKGAPATGARRFRLYQADQWMERFQDLVDFKVTYGHCLVPHDFPENQQLAQWVKRQRYQYKLKHLGRHSTLTDSRQQELEVMGFVWDAHKAAWFERFEALKEFQSQYGHSNVPSHYGDDRPLAIWVKCQRRQMKLFNKGLPSSMNQERFALLEQIGFVWNPRNL